MMETGDKHLQEDKFVYWVSESILVRLGGRRCARGKDRPLGFTKDGEKIVASYIDSRDYYRSWYYFQFWGSGATGERGETFTHVAVMSDMAVSLDEEAQRARRKRASSDAPAHGVSFALSTGMPRKADWPSHGYKFGFHYAQHRDHASGHPAAECGRL
jgi:hypothetical protein